MSSAFGMATDLLNDLRQVTEQAALEICSYKVGIWSLLPFSILSARIILSLQKGGVLQVSAHLVPLSSI